MNAWMMKSTRNIYEESHTTSNGNVRLECVGYLNADNDFVPKDGIPAIVPTSWIVCAEDCGLLTPVVRLIGDVFTPLDEWTEIEILRAER